MVLIPECLPILSELLEDSDEEVAGIAQECISQSEELLGESLQDSLR
jgi:U3 small nucleolar RNA-associated protein 10